MKDTGMVKLAEGMWILTVSPKVSKEPKPLLTNNCATFFSSDQKAVTCTQWIPSMQQHGCYKLGGWESLHQILVRLRDGGCTHIEVDPEPIVRSKMKIDDVIASVQRVLNGEHDLGVNPN